MIHYKLKCYNRKVSNIVLIAMDAQSAEMESRTDIKSNNKIGNSKRIIILMVKNNSKIQKSISHILCS